MNDNEKELLSYIDHETKVTEEQIDGLLSNVDVKHKISRSIIEKEIFDAASLIGKDDEESGYGQKVFMEIILHGGTMI